MDKFFAVLGKTVLVLILIGGIGYAAYTYGASSKQPAIAPATQTEVTIIPTTSALPSPSASTVTPTSAPSQTVTAGLNHADGILLPSYTVTVPAGWTTDHQQSLTASPSDRLTISNGMYKITIFQAAFGGGMCLYPGEPDQEGPSTRYTSYTEFAGAGGTVYRRGPTDSTPPSIGICQKPSSGTAFGNITSVGHIEYATPASPEATVLSQMDAIVATIKVQ